MDKHASLRGPDMTTHPIALEDMRAAQECSVAVSIRSHKDVPGIQALRANIGSYVQGDCFVTRFLLFVSSRASLMNLTSQLEGYFFREQWCCETTYCHERLELGLTQT